jgi:hypothetical protein
VGWWPAIDRGLLNDPLAGEECNRPQGRRAMTIIPFSVLEQESLVFDPSVLHILSDAFEQAWQSVQASGQADTHQEEMRELLAKCIIERAKLGDRNKDRLRDAALVHLAKAKLRNSAQLD